MKYLLMTTISAYKKPEPDKSNRSIMIYLNQINNTISTLFKAGILFASFAFVLTLFNPVDVQAQDSDEIYTVVDEMPEIVGGLSSLYNQIEYPRQAVRQGVEGRVFVQFVVDESGNAVDPVILRDIGAGCGEAAVKAIQKVKFTPGKQNGAPVKVKFSLPVSFEIKG
jgi:TonB family protein